MIDNSLLVKEAKYNLTKNTRVQNLAGADVRVIKPGDMYPGLWGWDSPFHAIGVAHYDIDLAIEQLEASAMGQAANGMIPCILFYDEELAEELYYPAPSVWKNYSASGLPISGISQPPTHGFALERIFHTAQRSKKKLNKDQISHLFDVCFQYQKWWYEERDPEGNGLVVSIHPWETGRDNSIEWDQSLNRIRETQAYEDFEFDPSVRKDIHINDDGNDNSNHRPKDEDYKMFTFLVEQAKSAGYSIKSDDRVYRDDIPFMVQDLTINSFLAASGESLLRLHDAGFGSKEQFEALREWTDKTREAIYQNLWNSAQSSYQSKDFKTGELSGVITHASFLPSLVSGCVKNRLDEVISTFDQSKKGRSFHIGSAPSNHDQYEPSRYWRGPIWPVVNWLVALGFVKTGRESKQPIFLDKAQDIRLDTLTLIGGAGFWEFFDAQTAEGCGEHDFSFTSMTCLEFLKSPDFAD